LDAEGAAELKDLPPGEWRLTAYGRIPGEALTISGRSDLSVTAGESRRVTIPIRAGLYRGSVTRLGRPVAGRIALRATGQAATTAALDSAGHFQLLLPAPGRYQAEVDELRADGQHSHSVVPSVSIESPDHEVEIALTGGRISGRVLSEEEQPIAGVIVSANGIRLDAGSGASIAHLDTEARSAADGGFTLDGLAGASWTIGVEESGRRSERAHFDLREDHVISGVTLHLVPVRTVTGQIVDAGGVPLTGATVVFSFPATDGGLAPFESVDSGPRGEFSATLSSRAFGLPFDLKVRAPDGTVAVSRRVLEDPLFVRLPPSGAAQLSLPADGSPSLLELLVADDGASVSFPFCGPARGQVEGHPAVTFAHLGVGRWRYVVVRDLRELGVVSRGDAALLPAQATFQVQSGSMVDVTVKGAAP
jgi:hypothetical protein